VTRATIRHVAKTSGGKRHFSLFEESNFHTVKQKISRMTYALDVATAIHQSTTRKIK
jgi:hypothetical protein